MRRLSIVLVALLGSTFVFSAAAARVDVTLRGSKASMIRQNEVATDGAYRFVEKPEDVDALVEEGELVHLGGRAAYEVLDDVSYPFARPEVRLFIERLAGQYLEATGEKLVVTSLTRPSGEQPRNAHRLSVHPAGIAVDLRISQSPAARQWLEGALLALEEKGVLDVTRERWPPHYHVALFPETYRAYLESLIGVEAVAQALAPPEATGAPLSLVLPAALITAVAPEAHEASPGLRVLALLAVILSALLYRRRVAPQEARRVRPPFPARPPSAR